MTSSFYTPAASFAGGFGFGYQVATAHNNEKTVKQGENYSLGSSYTRRLLSLVALEILNLNQKSSSHIILKASIFLTATISKFILAQALRLGAFAVDCHNSKSSTYMDYLYGKFRRLFNEKVYTYAIITPSEILVSKFGNVLIITEVIFCVFKLFSGFAFEALGTLSILALNIADQQNRLPQNISIMMGRYLPIISAVGLILTPNAIFLRLLGVLLLANEVAMPALNLIKYPVDQWFQKRNDKLHFTYPSLRELESNTENPPNLLNAENIQNLNENTGVVVNPAHINYASMVDLSTDNIDIEKGFEKHFKQFLVLDRSENLSLQNTLALATMKARILDEEKGRALLHKIREGQHPELKSSYDKVLEYIDTSSLPCHYYLNSETIGSLSWIELLREWVSSKGEKWDVLDESVIKKLQQRLVREGQDFIAKSLEENSIYTTLFDSTKDSDYHFQVKPVMKGPNNIPLTEIHRKNWIDFLKLVEDISPIFSIEEWDEYIAEKKNELIETSAGIKKITSAWETDKEELRAAIQKIILDKKEEIYKFVERKSTNLRDWIPLVKHFSKFQMDALISDLTGKTKAPGNLARFDETIYRAKQIIAYLDLLDKKISETREEKEKIAHKVRKDEILIPLLCEGGNFCAIGIDEAVENAFSNIFIETERPVTSFKSRLLHVLFKQRKRVNEAMYSAIRYLNPATALNAVMAFVEKKYKCDGRVDPHNYNAVMSLIGPDTGTSTTSLATDQTVQFNPILVLFARIILPQYRYAFWSSKSAVEIKDGRKKIACSKDLLDGLKDRIEEIKSSLVIIGKTILTFQSIYKENFKKVFSKNVDFSEKRKQAFTVVKEVGKNLYIIFREVITNAPAYFDLVNRLMFLVLEAAFNTYNLRYTSQSIVSEVIQGFNINYTKQEYVDWWSEYFRKNPQISQSLEIMNDLLDKDDKPKTKYLTAMLIEMGILKWAEDEIGNQHEKIYFKILDEHNISPFDWARPLIYALGKENIKEMAKLFSSSYSNEKHFNSECSSTPKIENSDSLTVQLP